MLESNTRPVFSRYPDRERPVNQTNQELLKNIQTGVSNMGIISWLLVGIIAGWLAGALFNIHQPITGFNLGTIVVAFLGAVIVLYIARLAKI